MNQLWFAPTEIDGYESIRQGFNRAIVTAMHQALGRYPQVLGTIERALDTERWRVLQGCRCRLDITTGKRSNAPTFKKPVAPMRVG
ncbi:MAG: hypothetical protein JXA37_04635 [Chloroflexia bacterium]|nr:hypothetical protein [Chloroflexia bacterium]